MVSKETLLQLKDATVQYGGVRALDGVSVSLDEGEVVALMGPNGAGKSTVLKAIFGIAPLSHGDVYWHEKKIYPVPHEVVQLGISFVPQGRRVFSSLTVEENIEIGAYGISQVKEMRRRRDEVMELFPALRAKKNAQAGTLSGGQQQMLALARGLMRDPKVLLLDEPSLGLAPKVVKEIFHKIKEINERHGTAIFIVEHNLKSLFEIVQRAYILDKGRVVYDGDIPTLQKTDLLEKVFLGAA
ncbi:MAG: ABC transporter ATP-binding protein [Patescibacteria group bacterium]